MRKILSAIAVAALLVIGSCAKDTTPNPGGSWTFKQASYNVNTCSASSATDKLIATASTGSLIINFFNSSYPSANGNYIDTVSPGPYPVAANHIGILVMVGNNAQAADYTPTGGNGAEQVYVTVTNGKIKITGAGLELRNSSVPADSAPVEFNITQLN